MYKCIYIMTNKEYNMKWAKEDPMEDGKLDRMQGIKRLAKNILPKRLADFFPPESPTTIASAAAWPIG
jgi:hypothetical protein